MTIARDDAVLLELLQQLVAEVRALRADVVRQRTAPAILSRGDRARLARLLPVIGAEIGSDPFAVRDLFDRASAALTIAMRGLSRRHVGRLLRRAVGQDVDGYVVCRDGDELHAAIWRLMQRPGVSGN